MKRTCLALAAIASAAAPAALAENQIWTSLDLEKQSGTNPRIEYQLNTELRYQPDGDLDTIEIRPGVRYRLKNQLDLSGGYLYASSRRDGPDQREHRLWQQLGYDVFKAGDWEFSGRTRIEERWREGADGIGYRLRQRFGVSHPVPGTELQFDLNSEAFIVLNDTGWTRSGVQENRARATVEWETGKGLEWSAGYLNQFRNGTNGSADETNHHLYIGLSAGF
ncbi:DUF2490 domain-containing protein [Hyphomonas sp.]|uniref:DUF2490 domain-containing protein n=1 Tax=Hyphomonas sp. TaxID=87 RepID=UPI00391B42B2